MTESIVQRLRETAATLPAARVSMQTLAPAHGPAAHGTWLLLMAVPCLLPVPGVGTVLGLGMAALAAAMGRGQSSACLPRRVRLPLQVGLGRPDAVHVRPRHRHSAGRHGPQRHRSEPRLTGLLPWSPRKEGAKGRLNCLSSDFRHPRMALPH